MGSLAGSSFRGRHPVDLSSITPASTQHERENWADSGSVMSYRPDHNPTIIDDSLSDFLKGGTKDHLPFPLTITINRGSDKFSDQEIQRPTSSSSSVRENPSHTFATQAHTPPYPTESPMEVPMPNPSHSLYPGSAHDLTLQQPEPKHPAPESEDDDRASFGPQSAAPKIMRFLKEWDSAVDLDSMLLGDPSTESGSPMAPSEAHVSRSDSPRAGKTSAPTIVSDQPEFDESVAFAWV
jgi:hypothetical protein